MPLEHLPAQDKSPLLGSRPEWVRSELYKIVINVPPENTGSGCNKGYSDIIELSLFNSSSRTPNFYAPLSDIQHNRTVNFERRRLWVFLWVHTAKTRIITSSSIINHQRTFDLKGCGLINVAYS